MTGSDIIQAVSFLLVAVALLMNRRQLQEMATQGRFMARSLEQSAYQLMVKSHADYRTAFFKDDPELLAWHLRTRGYTTGSGVENRKTLYMLVKLETHEANYKSHIEGLLDDEMWETWQVVMAADFSVREFQEVWGNARRFYASSFVEYIDGLPAMRMSVPQAKTGNGESHGSQIMTPPEV